MIITYIILELSNHVINLRYLPRQSANLIILIYWPVLPKILVIVWLYSHFQLHAFYVLQVHHLMAVLCPLWLEQPEVLQPENINSSYMHYSLTTWKWKLTNGGIALHLSVILIQVHLFKCWIKLLKIISKLFFIALDHAYYVPVMRF